MTTKFPRTKKGGTPRSPTLIRICYEFLESAKSVTERQSVEARVVRQESCIHRNRTISHICCRNSIQHIISIERNHTLTVFEYTASQLEVEHIVIDVVICQVVTINIINILCVAIN